MQGFSNDTLIDVSINLVKLAGIDYILYMKIGLEIFRDMGEDSEASSQTTGNENRN